MIPYMACMIHSHKLFEQTVYHHVLYIYINLSVRKNGTQFTHRNLYYLLHALIMLSTNSFLPSSKPGTTWSCTNGSYIYIYIYLNTEIYLDHIHDHVYFLYHVYIHDQVFIYIYHVYIYTVNLQSHDKHMYYILI